MNRSVDAAPDYLVERMATAAMRKGVRLGYWCLIAYVASISAVRAADEVAGNLASGIDWSTTAISADTKTTVQTLMTSNTLGKGTQIRLVSDKPISAWFKDEQLDCAASPRKQDITIAAPPPWQRTICVAADEPLKAQVLAHVSSPGRAAYLIRSPVIEFKASERKIDPVWFLVITTAIGFVAGFLSSLLTDWSKQWIANRQEKVQARVEAEKFLRTELLGELATHRTLLAAFVKSPAQWTKSNQNSLPLPALDELHTRAEQLAGYFATVQKASFIKEAVEYGDEASAFNLKIQALLRDPEQNRQYGEAVSAAKRLLKKLASFGFKLGEG